MKVIAFICVLTLVWFGFYIADVANVDFFNKIEHEKIYVERINTIKVPEYISKKPIKGKIKKQLVGKTDRVKSSSDTLQLDSIKSFSVDFITDSIKVYTTISILNGNPDSARLDSIWVQHPPIVERDSFMVSIPLSKNDLTVTDYLVYGLSLLGVYQIINWIME